MVTVVIPALNEAATIADVVRFARRNPRVQEVLVVDDGSIDGTPDLAQWAGARVITSSLLGKGASLEDGVAQAHHDIVVLLDADMSCLDPELIERITDPIMTLQADFVKAKFARQGGRVTLLTARPLLRTFFPEIVGFEQPLGGVVAARRSVLRAFRFENDYGVDVGLLIDAAMAGAKLAEVDVGTIHHCGQPLPALSNMAMQVTRAILDRASRYGRLSGAYLQQISESLRQSEAEPEPLFHRLAGAERVALFDMDGTLLDGRFILEFAERTGRQREL